MSTESLFAPRPPAVAPALAEADAQNEPQPETEEEQIAREREQLQQRLANHELDDVRTKVAYVLNQHPEARNSDVELTVRYWKTFHPDDVGRESVTYDALRSIARMSSLERARRHIQNKFGLFVADDAVADKRDELEGQVRQRQRAASKVVTPFVYVYADESGKNDKNYIVGSVWVNDVDEQSLILRQALTDWRKGLSWSGEFHLTDASKERAPDYVEFVRQAMKSSEYIGFKAVVVAKDDVRKRPTEDAIFKLHHRLIVDGMRHEVDTGRCTLPRNVVVWKDEDEGSDKLHLLALKDNLRAECPRQFDNQLRIADVGSLKSDKHILMQLADVFTGALNRTINVKGSGWKDDLARDILALLGMDAADMERDVKRDFASVI